MDVSTVACNICGQQKQEANHWFVAIHHPEMQGVLYLPADSVELPRRPVYVYEDICGQACSLKHHERWLDSLKAAATTAPESIEESAT
jgi:hypothetical protein